MSTLTERLGLPGDRGPRVLIVSAHPDDAEIGAGGTIARLAAERSDAEVVWVVLAAADPARATEGRASADQMLAGVARRTIVIGGLRDGYLPYLGPATKEALAEQAPFDPDVIFSPRRDDAHQDHRHIADIVPQVFRRALVLEYEVPKWDGDLGPANLYVPLTAADGAAKVDHIMEVFGSQRERTWFTRDTLAAMLRLRGIECRAPEGIAEAFVCRKFVV